MTEIGKFTDISMSRTLQSFLKSFHRFSTVTLTYSFIGTNMVRYLTVRDLFFRDKLVNFLLAVEKMDDA
jgi:hypothetical protein